MKTKLISKSHHRNGVCGAPFDVYLFRDEDKTTKLAIDFGEDRFAVLQVDLLAKGDIAFGSNSWRGDHYIATVRKLAGTKQDNARLGFSVNEQIKEAIAKAESNQT